jgi:hypothetical protein
LGSLICSKIRHGLSKIAQSAKNRPIWSPWQQHNFRTKKHGEIRSFKKAAFCLSHEKTARKSIDEIDTWWQKLPADMTHQMKLKKLKVKVEK